MVPRSVTTAVRAALRYAGVLEPASTLLLGVSGGTDSLCLLHAVAAVATPEGVTLHVAHIDHGLRPESADDAAHVQATCDRLSVPCSVVRVDVADYRRQHPTVTSIEAAARVLRYQAFADLAHFTGAAAVCTGHTRDDQVETVLLHLLRGAGPDALAGMPADTNLAMGDGPPLRVLRPLLWVDRSATEAYCAWAGLEPRTDPSNADPAFTRNRLRHQVIPALHTVNPALTQALTRLATQAQDDANYWSAQVEPLMPTVLHYPGGLPALNVPALRDLPPALLTRLLRAAVHRATTLDLEWSHVEALLDLVWGDEGRTAVLPAGTLARRIRHVVLLETPPLDFGPRPPAAVLPPEGTIAWGPWELTTRLVDGNLAPDRPSPWSVALDADEGGAVPAVRTRRPGDRFQPLGLRHAKKLQDLWVDAHVPAVLRDHLPLVESADGRLLWAAGLRVAEHAKVTPATRRMLHVAARPTSPTLAAVLRLCESRHYNDETSSPARLPARDIT